MDEVNVYSTATILPYCSSPRQAALICLHMINDNMVTEYSTHQHFEIAWQTRKISATLNIACQSTVSKDVAEGPDARNTAGKAGNIHISINNVYHRICLEASPQYVFNRRNRSGAWRTSIVIAGNIERTRMAVKRHWTTKPLLYRMENWSPAAFSEQRIVSG